MTPAKVIVATIKSWNIEAAQKLSSLADVTLITDKTQLTLERLEDLKPDFIFFPHWSWKIPKEIHQRFNCIGFHMTNLPFGRGGSPLQNLIVRGIKQTKISAIQIEEGMDTGAIYLQEDLDISEGSAETIFRRMSQIIFEKMIPALITERPQPQAQSGEVTEFERRKPEQSNLQNAELQSLDQAYDFIRMLDAEGYPKAYLQIGNLKLELSDVQKNNQTLHGTFQLHSQ